MIDNNELIIIVMKKNYIIPYTESVAFNAGSICDISAGAGTSTGGTTVGGGTLGGGGEVPGGISIDPQ